MVVVRVAADLDGLSALDTLCVPGSNAEAAIDRVAAIDKCASGENPGIVMRARVATAVPFQRRMHDFDSIDFCIGVHPYYQMTTS